VRELADRIVVLHNGKLVADGEPEAVIASPIVQEAYLGLTPEISLTAQDGAPSPRPSPAGREREDAA
jgi:branched-chain amino acid transport system ATP-binding protein